MSLSGARCRSAVLHTVCLCLCLCLLVHLDFPLFFLYSENIFPPQLLYPKGQLYVPLSPLVSLNPRTNSTCHVPSINQCSSCSSFPFLNLYTHVHRCRLHLLPPLVRSFSIFTTPNKGPHQDHASNEVNKRRYIYFHLYIIILNYYRCPFCYKFFFLVHIVYNLT